MHAAAAGDTASPLAIKSVAAQVMHDAYISGRDS